MGPDGPPTVRNLRPSADGRVTDRRTVVAQRAALRRRCCTNLSARRVMRRLRCSEFALDPSEPSMFGPPVRAHSSVGRLHLVGRLSDVEQPLRDAVPHAGLLDEQGCLRLVTYRDLEVRCSGGAVTEQLELDLPASNPFGSQQAATSQYQPCSSGHASTTSPFKGNTPMLDDIVTPVCRRVPPPTGCTRPRGPRCPSVPRGVEPDRALGWMGAARPPRTWTVVLFRRTASR